MSKIKKGSNAVLIGGLTVNIGIGVVAALVNGLLSIAITVRASTESAIKALAIIMVSMVVRLAGLTFLFVMLYKIGYVMMPLMSSFVIVYTILLGIEAMVLKRERSG